MKWKFTPLIWYWMICKWVDDIKMDPKAMWVGTGFCWLWIWSRHSKESVGIVKYRNCLTSWTGTRFVWKSLHHKGCASSLCQHIFSIVLTKECFINRLQDSYLQAQKPITGYSQFNLPSIWITCFPEAHPVVLSLYPIKL